MKYLKRFNESILDDVRSKVDNSISNIKNKFGKNKFCRECGTEVDDKFCRECGTEVDGEINDNNDFEIKGRLEEDTNSLSKTPILTIRSMNKTIDGTPVTSGMLSIIPDIAKYIGKEVTIKGTTKDGEKPSFRNPIMVNEIK
jgi:hypothetical protein